MEKFQHILCIVKMKRCLKIKGFFMYKIQDERHDELRNGVAPIIEKLSFFQLCS